MCVGLHGGTGISIGKLFFPSLRTVSHENARQPEACIAAYVICPYLLFASFECSKTTRALAADVAQVAGAVGVQL